MRPGSESDVALDDPSASRIAIVTGGAGGIGRAIVAELRRTGCEVVATGVNEAEFAQHRDDEALAGVDWRVLDVGDDAAVQAFSGGFPELDILVNCAGITVRGPLAFEEDAFVKVVDINLHGTMRMCRAMRSALAASRGCIVNIASMMSLFGSGTAPGYAASKGAVSQLTKSLAIAWAADGIRVNAIAPGWIETPMTRDTIKRNDPALYDRVQTRTPTGHWGQPEDIAAVVPFLCSPAARFVTGVILPVDGGYSIA